MRSDWPIAAPPPIAEDAQQRIDALTRRFEQLEARLSVLEARRPRDAEDERLRQLLPEATQRLPFTALELVRHATVDEDLAAALTACCLNGSREVGSWLRLQRGCRDGVAIERIGRRWRAFVTHDVHGADE